MSVDQFAIQLNILSQNIMSKQQNINKTIYNSKNWHFYAKIPMRNKK